MTEPPATSEDGRRSRWTDHRVQRRAFFVAAGAHAVDRWGPGASAEQIADAAGVSRTVLYRYFRDREDLRQAIADRVITTVLEHVLPQLQVTEQSTPREVVTAAVSATVTWLDEHPNLYRFLRGRRDGGAGLGGDHARRQRRRAAQGGADVLRPGRADRRTRRIRHRRLRRGDRPAGGWSTARCHASR